MNSNEIPEVIEANVLRAVTVGTTPGTLYVNDIDVVDKINSNANRIHAVETIVRNHEKDINTEVSQSRYHLTAEDITNISKINSKAKQEDLAALEETVSGFGARISDKASKTDLDELKNSAVTYKTDDAYPNRNIFEQENLTFLNNDLSFVNSRLVMENNSIELLNHCANINGPESTIYIKDVESNNLVTATGNGEDGSVGDVIVDRGIEGTVSLWDHTHNKVVHITADERDRWNKNTGGATFVIAPADEEGFPDVESKNTFTIYLVPIEDSSEANVNYTKWIWSLQSDETYRWEKIAPTDINLSEYAKITDVQAVNERVDDVENNINEHIADEESHITDEERNNWNSHIDDEQVHVTLEDKSTWNEKQDKISLTPTTNTDITDTSTFESNTITHQLSLNKITSSTGIKSNESKVPTAGAVADFSNQSYVKKTGDTMNGGLIIDSSYGLSVKGTQNNPTLVSIDKGSINLNLASGNVGALNSIGHVTAGNTDYGEEGNKDVVFTDLSSNGIIIMNDKPTEQTYDVVGITNLGVASTVYFKNESGDDYEVSGAMITKTGDAYLSGRLATNAITPLEPVHVITFYSIEETEGVLDYGDVKLTVSATKSTDDNAPIVMIYANKDNNSNSQNQCDVVIAGKSVYDHITDEYKHLTRDQMNVIKAGESGCFIYKPTEPDPSQPDEPYKTINPKLLLKNVQSKVDENKHTVEATLQLGQAEDSAIKLVGEHYDDERKNKNYVIITNGQHEGGKEIEITDDGIEIKASYSRDPNPNANLKIFGDTAIGDDTTNYTFTVNGEEIISGGSSISPVTGEVTLANNKAFSLSANAISIRPADVTDRIVKSTILFTPTEDVDVVNLFASENVDKYVCTETIFFETHDVRIETTLTANKLSMIEITQINTGGINYITALITPNIK